MDYTNSGHLTPETNAIVMDNVIDRDKHKPKVKVVITSVPAIYIGSSTVAVFRVKLKENGNSLLQQVPSELGSIMDGAG